MNKLKELEKKIEKLSKELEDLKHELDKEKSNNCERYRANCGEKYYYYGSMGMVSDCDESNDEYDINRYAMGNYFQTREEAEKVVEKIKIYIQLKDLALRLNNGEEIDWKNDKQDKYCIVWDVLNNKNLYCSYAVTVGDIGQIYCLDKNFLDIAKQEIGEENLKKLFG